MNKRGMFLLKHLVEIIIAVIVVGIIIYAGVVLFQTYFGRQTDMQAKGILDRITEKLNDLDIGETDYVILTAPSDWNIVAFGTQNNLNGNFERPSGMFGQNILCVCKGKCKSDFCQSIGMPLKKDGELANIRIKLVKLWLTNKEIYYEASEKSTVSIHGL